MFETHNTTTTNSITLFKKLTMKRYILPSLIALMFLSACGNSKKEGDAALNDKKAKLEKLKAENDQNTQEIAKLQEEIST
ncbi:MAG: hypothetical protein EOO03_13240, partial [Chitinophagaceae bacterium]